MPKPVRITGRTSSITNSFVNGIIPVVWPTNDQIEQALRVLGMVDAVCSYCGGVATEWDHLRPLVIDKKPTGYISEIHNLVPACGKCNQSKGNKVWHEWMFSSAPLSPQTRGVASLKDRAARLEDFERWGTPTRIDFESIVGPDLWAEHWRNHESIVELMRHAEATAEEIRSRVAGSPLKLQPPTLEGTPTTLLDEESTAVLSPSEASPTEHLVFSYGTLRLPSVQAVLFGGPVPTVDDALVGWRLDEVVITDPAVIAASGSDRHPILLPGGAGDTVPGAVLTVDDAGLAAIDDYEVDDYERVEADTLRGRRVWVFVAAS